jgi:putative ABC transport system substrate-binding protein
MLSRTFCLLAIVGAVILVGAPVATAEQARRLPRIGVLWPSLVDQWDKAFRDGLRENGYVHGATAVIDIRATGGNLESGAALAEELIASKPDVIYAVPGVLAKEIVNAEKRAGKEIPIVVITQDPMAEGLVASVTHPGGNITGLAVVASPGELMTKHLQLLKEMIPRLRRIGCLTDTSWKEFSVLTKAALEKAGPQIGVRVISIDVRGADDIEHALSEIAKQRVDAMIIPLTPMFLATRGRIISFASKHHLPTAYAEEVFTYDGGLMSYGPSVSDRYRGAAGIIARILHGAKPEDIPLDYNSRFRLVVNLRVAKVLQLKIPQSVLLQADELIK